MNYTSPHQMTMAERTKRMKQLATLEEKTRFTEAWRKYKNQLKNLL